MPAGAKGNILTARVLFAGLGINSSDFVKLFTACFGFCASDAEVGDAWCANMNGRWLLEWLPHLVCQKLLVNLTVVHLLFDGAAGDETVHRHIALLPNPPSSLAGLHVRRGVPVWIIQQHPVSPCRSARATDNNASFIPLFQIVGIMPDTFSGLRVDDRINRSKAGPQKICTWP